MAVGASRVTDTDRGGTPAGAPPDPSSEPGHRFTRWVPLLALPALALLALASWLGRHVRPSADEWCFIPQVRDHGVLGLVDTFYSTDNGRLANGVLVGLYTRFPVAGHQWYGLISGVVILLVLWAFLRLVLRRTRQEAPPGTAFFAASVVTALFLFATTNTYKTFYWPAASVSHTLAPVLAVAAALPLLTARTPRGRKAAVAAVFLAGAFMGTLSEEASLVALVVLGAAVVLARRVFAPGARRHARIWSLAGMAGIAAGTLVLMTSPGSRNRRERYDAETVSMLAPESLVGALRQYVLILETVFTTWQYLGAVAAGVLLGLLTRRRPGPGTALRPLRPLPVLGLGLLTFLVTGYLCAVITYPVFGDRLITTERTWNDYLLLYVLLLVAAGAFLGRALRPVEGRRPATRTAVVAVAAAALTVTAVGSLYPPLLRLGDDMETRADRWDRQDQWMREQAEAGATTLPYRPNRVGRMLEPFGRNGTHKWPAQCIADYYGVEDITQGPPFPK
ncbi:hypothetical protein BJP40_18735 [Streptomyces sp. CC53]|uniref:DUF6056 family protein n=1 Tax=unclassified Streptomyces TaxID=2593676 RepID=UPI0008DCE095|nr:MULTISPECIES: DUF6056 family protein [unclassified Streptomyces]OII65018.1 hypothetical protein BJP40_18735 [Streptomyces sp. CC53]